MDINNEHEINKNRNYFKSDEYKLKKRVVYLESLIKEITGEKPIEKKYYCPICNSSLEIFHPFGGLLYPNSQCPNCGSLERHRSLFLHMLKVGNIIDSKNKIKILHFAPEPCFSHVFENNENINYITANLTKEIYLKELDFLCGKLNEKYLNDLNFIQEEIDMQEIPFEDETLDVIISNHVLEHVPDDIKAVNECFRTLKPGGIMFITVPILAEKTFQEDFINTPELREKYYGEEEHMRAYGRDIKDMFNEAGFITEEYLNEEYFSEEEIIKYKLNPSCGFEIQYICKKPLND